MPLATNDRSVDLGAAIDDLCFRLATFKVDDVDEATRQKAVACLIDTVGVGLAGSSQPAARRATRWARENFRSGAAQMLNRRERLVPAGAAFANAVACHALDFDDTCYDGIVHASAIVLPAALATTERCDGSGIVLLEAFMAGCQAAVEVGRLMTDGLYHRGWFNTGLLGQLGASVAASRAARAPRDQLQRALSLATCDTGGFRAVLGSEAKPYLAGAAAEAGLRASDMAAAGLSVPADPWTHPCGFAATLAHGIAPQRHPRQGEWCFSSPGVALKLYPVCSAAQAAAEGLQLELARHGIDAASVARVEVGGTDLVVRSLRFVEPATPSEAQFSMNFALGCILRFGRLGPAELTAETLTDPTLRAEMAKVRLVLDEQLEAAPGRADTAPEAARLSIFLTDGRRLMCEVAAASGMPAKPFDERQLQAKFIANADHAGWDEDVAIRLFEQLWAIERLPTLKLLHLAPSRTAAAALPATLSP